jgi:hypothetical protein
MSEVERHELQMPFGTLVDLDTWVLDLGSPSGPRDHPARTTENLTEAFDLLISHKPHFVEGINPLFFNKSLGGSFGEANPSHGCAHHSVLHG